MIKSFFTILLISGIHIAAFAQCFLDTDGRWKDRSTGQDCGLAIVTPISMLRITPDARGAAMGDAGIAVSADANAMFYNSSKLAFAEEDFGLALNYTPWLRNLGIDDIYLAYASGFKKLDELQTIGFDLRFFSYGNIDFTDVNGASLGSSKPNEFSIGLSYNRKLGEYLAAGLTGRFIYSDLASGLELSDGTNIFSATAGTVDLSFTYARPLAGKGMKKDLRMGLAITNVGNKISYTREVDRETYFLPGNIGLGGALDIHLDDYNVITFTTDFNKLLVPSPTPIDGGGIDYNHDKSLISGMLGSFTDAANGFSEEMREITIAAGVEYWYDRQFALRAGYFYESFFKGGRRYLTLGAGLKMNIFGVNLSYLVPTSNQRSALDNTLRFSLVFDFANQAKP